MVPFPGRVMSGGRIPLENKINKTISKFLLPLRAACTAFIARSIGYPCRVLSPRP